MDFMKWLNSLDELLYEVMSWLLFFPVTLWRASVQPLRTMGYVEQQVSVPAEEQYAAVLSPPLFLAWRFCLPMVFQWHSAKLTKLSPTGLGSQR